MAKKIKTQNQPSQMGRLWNRKRFLEVLLKKEKDSHVLALIGIAQEIKNVEQEIKSLEQRRHDFKMANNHTYKPFEGLWAHKACQDLG